MPQLWGGRFSSGLDPLAWEYNASLAFDRRLARYDVRGSIAWAQALVKANIITSDEGADIVAGLQQILMDIANDSFEFAPEDEDIHSAVERRLVEMVGPVGGKLHTGRSRNDQVATDFALWMIQTTDNLSLLLKDLQQSLIDRAELDWGQIVTGYTHLQRSQPILISHWWLSHFWPLERDRERLAQLRQRASVLPLGSGAMAGSSFPIDRIFLANALGFSSVSPNSIDAVASRDSAAEFLFTSALLATHLSRLAETLILFATAEFGFIELSDTYATGSSLMPQKKNPDPLELTRGKAATIIGRLAGFLAVLKGLPSAYDKDLQEDKVPVFETSDTLHLMLPVMAGVLSTLTLHQDRLQQSLDPAILATDLADYLVRKDIPFREAHNLTGQAVRLAQEKGIKLNQLTSADFQSINSAFGEDVRQVFDFQAALSRRNITGGTGPEAVKAQLKLAKEKLTKS